MINWRDGKVNKTVKLGYINSNLYFELYIDTLHYFVYLPKGRIDRNIFDIKNQKEGRKLANSLIRKIFRKDFIENLISEL